MMRKLFVRLFVVLSLFIFNFTILYSASDFSDLSIKLVSDKSEYVEGEEIKLSLEITNPNIVDVLGQLSGESVVGNTGFDISCMEFTFPKEQGLSLQVLSAQAQMSSSNVKTITLFSSCGGSQSQSTQTITSSGAVSSGVVEEVVTLNPFSLKYSFNGTDYDVLSNSLDIKIIKKPEEEQEESEESEEQQEQKEQQEQEQQNQEQSEEQQGEQSGEQNQQTSSNGQQQAQNQEQNSGENGETGESEESGDESENEMPEIPKGEELSPEKQQALKNNQQNQQSLSQLKKEISKIKVNESDLTKKNLSFENQTLNQTLDLLSESQLKELRGEKNSNWKIIITSLLFVILVYFIYLKYFKKVPEIIEDKIVQIDIIPYYLELLDLVLVEKDYKVRVKMLAQSVREFEFVSLDLDFVPTNNECLKITKNNMFKNILKKAERIEFARSSDKLDIKDLVISLRKEFSKILKLGENKNE